MIFPLRAHEKPIPAPRVSTLIPIIPPVPVVASEVRELVASQLKALRALAVNVTGQLDRLAQLDKAHQTELLPALYKNVGAHASVVRSCGSDCRGSVQLNLTYFEACQDPDILLKVKQNRTEWLATVTVPPHASCCAIVQLEACLTQLVQRHRKALPTDKTALEVLGAEVFFDLVQATHEQITGYSPTRQFLTLCLDMCGQEFVCNRASQCLPVLQAMLKDPKTISHVSPFFTPVAADDEQYVHMYRLLGSCLVPALCSSVFVLLSKFSLPRWLTKHTPSRAVRSHLLVSLEMMLAKCGHDPEQTNINVMSLVWQHYFVKYVWTTLPQHVTDTVQAAFYKLPWSQFSPSVEDVRLACKLLDVKYVVHQTFLAQVFIKVPWKACLHDALHLAPELLMDYYSSFAELVLGLAWHPNMAKFIATSLKSLHKYNWNVVPVDVVWRLQKMFAGSCNVHLLLNSSPGIEKTVLEFVATLSCMHPGCENEPHKQHAFVSTLVGLYSSALDVADSKDLVSLLPHLLDRCLNVRGPVVLLGRALSLLDSCQEGSPQAQALVEGLLPWLEARAGQPVLLSVLTAACVNVASVQQLVRVTEACLTAFLEGSLAEDGGWAHAVTAFQIPELTLDNFLEQCTCQAAHLTQLIYVLRCLPQCRDTEDEWVLLDQLANWVAQGCTTCTGETSELKLLLLWSKLLVLSVRQLDFGSQS
ncbi:hypothetical protein HPB50_017635 [Hyalomma asiaticum]|uniref:Uncharacterized protein n=1 Tax=Hyalomma asiaticum TaxID=266040 RepID=A0ACB7RMU2_HYAAI|nr:hypothetical protein HPB50_017635 [Hyalomma asiaticum]